MYETCPTTHRQGDILNPDTGSVGVALNFEVGHEGDALQQWIKLIPAGSFMGRDGRAFLNDQAEGIVAAFTAHQAALPVDVEHSSELKARAGDPAPACGWIEELQVRAGAVWGRIEWNRLGVELIRNREYRYYSPVFLFDRPSGRVINLKSAGLTNTPNLFSTELNQYAVPTNMYFPKLVSANSGLTNAVSELEARVALNAEEQQVCRSLGMSTEAFAKAKVEAVAMSSWSPTGQSNQLGRGGQPAAVNAEEQQVCRSLGMSTEAFAKAKAKAEQEESSR